MSKSIRPVLGARDRTGERGGAMVEFAFSSVVWMPLLLGAMSIGFNLVRTVQLIHINRDSGHMYANGIDFTLAANQQTLRTIANGLDFSASGKGVFVFSTILMTTATDCTSAGLVANSSSCPNLNKMVVIQRYTMGNPASFTTTFGNPSSSAINSSGNVSASYYMTNANAVATGFGSVLNLASGETAYLVETFYSSTDYNITGFMNGNTIYERSVF